jgi:hypothetical protein
LLIKIFNKVKDFLNDNLENIFVCSQRKYFPDCQKVMGSCFLFYFLNVYKKKERKKILKIFEQQFGKYFI